MQHRYVVPLLVLALSLGAPGCKKKTPELAPAPPVAKPQPAREERATPPARPDEGERFPTERPETGEVDLSADELNRQGVLRTVYFAYDSSELDDPALATLRANAAWLKTNPDREVVVEGHCDERGTIDYNLALGERRARSVRQHLASLGVDDSQLRIVTYGEERPADPGHGEPAWSKNRRAQFLIER